MTTTTSGMTAEELLHLSNSEGRYELIRGELKHMAPAGFEHGVTIVNLTGPLSQYVRAEGLGMVSGAETGFQIASNPDTVRAPDIAFVRHQRISAGALPRGYFPGAPDLAVEVVSPGDTAPKVADKVQDWLGAGTQLVWVLYPPRHLIEVNRIEGESSTLRSGDLLDGENVVPGFSLPVDEIFS